VNAIRKQQILTQVDQASKRLLVIDLPWVGRKALAVLISGVTIGFVFAMYVVLGFSDNPSFRGIGAIGTAMVLYVCMERLYRDTSFIFVGCFYLGMIGALASAAITSRFPEEMMLPISLWSPSLYMIAMLTVFWIFKLAANAITPLFKRVFRGNRIQNLR
jgi:hypothetical protein